MAAASLWRMLKSQPGKLLRKDLGESWRVARDDRTVVAIWWHALPNWGDIVNPVLIEHLSGRRAVPYDRIVNLGGRPVYGVIGSVLDRAAVPRLEVWGSGFKEAGARFLLRPRRVHAVRGPLTRDAILRRGLDCPPVYGDPALLFPRIYRPAGPKRFRLGIVPHYVDRDRPALDRFRADPDVLIVDILAGVREVADQIWSCEAIASSSLHGMVLADAYGLPSTWVEFSGDVEGGGFKFRDYLAGVNRAEQTPLVVTDGIGRAQIEARFPTDPAAPDLERLLAACPFRREAL